MASVETEVREKGIYIVSLFLSDVAFVRLLVQVKCCTCLIELTKEESKGLAANSQRYLY